MIRKLRICFFAPFPSVHTSRFLDYFSEQGHDVYLLSGRQYGFKHWPFESNQGMSSSVIRSIQYRDQNLCKYLRVLRPIYGVKSVKETFKFLRLINLIRRQTDEIKPDIIHTLWLGYGAFRALLTGIRPRVLTVWGSDIRYLDSLPWSKKLMLQIALRSADAITGFGSAELLMLCQARGVKPDRCYNIGAPGVNIDHFNNPTSNNLREALGIPADADIILSPRALRPLYQIDVIVRAFEQVHSQCSRTVLVVLSYNEQSEYKQRLKDLIKETGLQRNVWILNSVTYDQMPKIYAESSVAVTIPKSDGMPQTILEAWAANCPVVASDLSTYDGIVVDGETGMRVPGNNPTAVAHAILRILKDERLRCNLTENGHRTVKELGNIQVEMGKIEQLYYDLLENRCDQSPSFSRM